MNIQYEVLNLENLSAVEQLCNDLMHFQKSKAIIHPEWFDNMNYQTRLIPSVTGALENLIIVAKADNQIVGYAYSNVCKKTVYSGGFATLAPVDFFDFSTIKSDNVGCLSQFYLNQDYRGYHIGSELFDRSMVWLEGFKDISDLVIFVSNGNAQALDFYVKKGFIYSHDILDGFIYVLRKSNG